MAVSPALGLSQNFLRLLGPIKREAGAGLSPFERRKTKFAVSHGLSRLDQIAVRVVETGYRLSPAVGHQPMDIVNAGVCFFQLFDERLDVRLFKIQLAGVAFRDDVPIQGFLPNFIILKNRPVPLEHLAVIVGNHIEAEQVVIESPRPFHVPDGDQNAFNFMLVCSPARRCVHTPCRSFSAF